MYNAVIIPRLTHGLETMYLNDSLLKRLDAFHMRGVRHIMGIEHAYWSRVKNKEIIEKANRALNRGVDITKNWTEFMIPGQQRKEKKLRLVSGTLMLRRRTLLGHVIRCEENDPMYQVTFKDDGQF